MAFLLGPGLFLLFSAHAYAQPITIGGTTFELGIDAFPSSVVQLAGSAPNPFGGISATDGLTGADIDTGAFNLNVSHIFELTFPVPIVNQPEDDIYFTDSRFSFDGLGFSLDGGATFHTININNFLDTGVNSTIRNTGFDFRLFAATIDMSDFGFALGESISSLQIRGVSESDPIVIGNLNRQAAEFTINVTSFIPANHLTGPPQSRCGRGKQLSFAGDDRTFSPTADSFRTRQLVTVITEEASGPDAFKEGSDQNLVGESKAYAPDALEDGIIDAADDDGILNDCQLLHDIDTASNENMRITVSRINEHEVSVRLFGGAANPLVRLAPEINWDFTVTIDTSGEKPRWTLTGAHDGFPAFEIYINNIPIDTFDPGPPPYTFRQHLRKLFPPLDEPVDTSGELP